MEEIESGNLFLCKDQEFATEAESRASVELLKNKKENQ
jgi:hypothetical protein